jgi:hypothetical protein
MVGILGGNPADQIVFVRISVCVLDSELSFPDSAKAMQGMWEQCHFLAAADQHGMQFVQHIAPAREVGVALGHIAHDREHRRFRLSDSPPAVVYSGRVTGLGQVCSI